VRGGAGDRTSRGERCRSSRRSFFSPPHETDEPRSWVAEHPHNACQRTKPGERICIHQATELACSWHRQIMPSFHAFTTVTKLLEIKARLSMRDAELPTRNHEDPELSCETDPSEKGSPVNVVFRLGIDPLTERSACALHPSDESHAGSG
jgi:hypothetical protein